MSNFLLFKGVFPCINVNQELQIIVNAPEFIKAQCKTEKTLKIKIACVMTE